ncbi:hypothetical protein BsWGS_17706 [Bradybaena similaris]
MQHIDWKHINFNELDTILRINPQDKSMINEEIGVSGTPLALACKHKREDLLTVLLFHGARTDKCVSCDLRQPLHYACDHKSGNRGMVRKLLESGAEINAQDIDGFTGLHLACRKGNIPVVELLLENGARVDLAGLRRNTPLVDACCSFSADLVNILLKAGSDPNVSDGLPVKVAISTPSPTILNLLVDAGAQVVGKGYLSIACSTGYMQIIKTLLEYDVDVNEPNQKNMTPLESALHSSINCASTLRVLLENGASIHLVPSLLHLACCFSNTAAIKLLLAYGADANVSDSFGNPLMTILRKIEDWHIDPTKRHVQTVHLLIAAGSKLSHGHLKIANITNRSMKPMSDELKTILAMLMEMEASPADLQFQCRIVIRRSVPPNKDEHIAKLPLPNQVIRYLTFDEVE